MIPAKTKYLHIRDTILRDIRSGKYEPGQRLPSERVLAELYGVSHMTARRAITDMVESEVLVRHDREGIFLHANALDLLHLQTVNLICSSYEAAIITDFLRLGTQLVESNGGNANVFRVGNTQTRSAIKVIMEGQPCMILSDDCMLRKPFINAMQSADANVVLVGNNLSMLGISSVMSDDTTSIRMTVDMLKSKGHTRIAFISHNLEHPNEKIMANAWASCFADQPEEKVKKRLLLAPTPPFESCSDYVFDAVKEYLNSGEADATAYICQLDEAVLGAMAACRLTGLKIPEDVSFVSAVESPITRYMDPPVTVLGPDFPKHIEVALALLEEGTKGSLKLIPPKLIRNGSVADI